MPLPSGTPTIRNHARLDRRRGDVDLGAVEADQRPALGFREAELFALGVGHWRDRVEKSGSVPVSAGTASAVGIAGLGCAALAFMLRQVDRAFHVRCEPRQDDRYAVEGVVIVFIGGVGLYQRVDLDDINLTLDDEGA